MVCGGQNSTCLHHKSVYQSNGLQAGRTHARTHAHTQSVLPSGTDCCVFRPPRPRDISRLLLPIRGKSEKSPWQQSDKRKAPWLTSRNCRKVYRKEEE